MKKTPKGVVVYTEEEKNIIFEGKRVCTTFFASFFIFIILSVLKLSSWLFTLFVILSFISMVQTRRI